ncbi:NupC/NupG family nucleoside CNT transporter [Desulfosarcina ovata]|uniref:Nucleoside:proton symporter n=1 Tax=Desulfosarcina ovata subsp. ovata TaxID=2752305 RepID=A0A5K8AGN6_9BACT|nr:nucleoside transporter C-terminal domain-containing protein [Desulfosarcina ovata]BBO91791.1 nucleoside:proton symporter [Desulfosarcina ovata subsp. ovata]
MMQMVQSGIGLLALLAVAYLFSENRKTIHWRTVGYAVGLQGLLAIILLKVPVTRHLFLMLNVLVNALEKALQEGTAMVFGYLGGGALPFSGTGASTYIFAFRGLPMVLLASALSALLFYWRILPWIVRGVAWLLRRTLGIGGAEGLANAANIFIGMVEAPLFIRPYVADISRGELFSIMTCGMATIAGTVMVLYAGVLKPVVPDAMGHLLTASIISAPAAIALARIMVPTVPEARTEASITIPVPADSAMEAITNGTLDGVKLLINIIAMLVVLVALVGLVNIALGWLPDMGGTPLTLQRLLGILMAPVMWLIGIPWSECMTAGSLMGTKTVLNEFLAYLEMAHLDPSALSARSRLILTYAMCGFANPGSLGIMLGGLGAMAPERRNEIVQLGARSILAGILATCMTGTMVGMLTG